ncbi:serine protease [Iamia sp. SCSIO 61187]|uniref:S1 family peptidase n=1 Tax=Iamia sp. SCSIO 61187 TaxID=2722752 RepID=UPI001C635E4A|nr:S1 family peptidase [Iamia sp. SCSIO 61187]QYG94773.1 serine protease [Iamia sp. SCSIO 61187]
MTPRTPHRRRVPAALAALGLALVAVLAGAPAPASAYAPADTATIHPGVQMFTDGAQCTANFVFSDGTDLYIGYAAHCAGLGEATDTDGCLAGTLPVGTPVEIDGASQPGTLAYSSWATMQAVGETDPDACAYNDLALVRIDPADHDKVNPSVPHWGGPTGINTTGVGALTRVYSYGNSSLRQGITLLSPKTGVSLGTTGGGWTHPLYTVSPGIPGDSGSAFLDAQGRALGVLSTLALAPLPLSNNVSDLNKGLEYMRAHTTLDAISLVPGDLAFDGDQLPLGL